MFAETNSSRSVKERDVVLLVNTRALNGQEQFDTAKEQLVSRGFSVAYGHQFKDPSQLSKYAVSENWKNKLVVVGGGDGTLTAVANLLAYTDSVLGVIPLGTGNAFARDLGIPTSVESSLEVLRAGKIAQVDMGKCQGKYFLNVATLGITTNVARNLTVPLKRRFGRLVYGIALYRALKSTQPFTANLVTENGATSLRAIEMVIGNGHYHGGPLPISPTASLVSGKLSLYAVEAGSSASLLRYALMLPMGKHGILNTVHAENCITGKLITEPIQSVVIDGEISAKTPIEFNVEPSCLKVMVPIDFEE